MENKQQNRKYRNNNNKQNQRHQRKRRVSVDKNVEVVVVSNSKNRIVYKNPRMNTEIDLYQIGDEEYLTVSDLRAIMNTSRKMLEGFTLLITDVLDDKYTVEDVLIFLGLDKKYQEYFSLSRKSIGDNADISDIKNFIIKSPVHIFEKQLKTVNDSLRSKIIETSVTIFKLGQFSDYNKMRIIQTYVTDELFDDAQETEIDKDIYI